LASVNNVNNISYLRRAADILIFNRLNNLSDAGAYISHKILPYMDREELWSIQRDNPHNQKLHCYYPFTSYDPSDPWYERISARIFSESIAYKTERLQHLRACVAS
jgi:hypothetical protein